MALLEAIDALQRPDRFQQFLLAREAVPKAAWVRGQCLSTG